MTVVLIEQLTRDGTERTFSHGTGFMWRALDGLWLITARHVLSGTNPFDGSHLSNLRYEPNEIRVHLGVGLGTNDYQRASCILRLRSEDGLALWAEDPEFNTLRTDIAALPVDVGRPDVFCINDAPDFGKHDSMFAHVGFSCFVAGYPTLEIDGLKLPIWRTGAIASDPVLPIDDKPIFLMDAATGPGFSGSPVWLMQTGPTAYHDDTIKGGIRIDVDAVLRSTFVGVYAGRLNHSHVGAQTPYVFYGNRIPIILAANAGRKPLNPI